MMKLIVLKIYKGGERYLIADKITAFRKFGEAYRVYAGGEFFDVTDTIDEIQAKLKKASV